MEEIMMNNEVVEETMEVAKSGSVLKNGVKIAAGLALITGVGVLTYKGAKFIASKIKSAKNRKGEVIECEDYNEVEESDSSDSE